MNLRPVSRKQALEQRLSKKGFSLVEVVLAMSILAVAMICILGMLGAGVVNDRVSSQQTAATNIAESILADLRATPPYATGGLSTRYGLALPTTGGGTTAAPLSGLPSAQSPVLYFDNSPIFISVNPATVPVNAAYVAHVYMSRIAVTGPATTPALQQSNDMARVVITWPAQTTTLPAGSVDVIAQFLVK